MQRRSPQWMRCSIFSFLNTARDFAVLGLRRHFNVYQMAGQANKGPITVVYAENGEHRSFRLYLEDIFFAKEPVVKKYQLPIWRVGELINDSNSDLTFILANKVLINKLPTRNTILMPHVLNQTLDIRGRWEDVLQRFHKTIRRNELRLIRKYNYEAEISDKDTDFEKFFHEMYLPSMKTRHGEQAQLRSYEKAYRHFKRGVLILVKRDGEVVGGGLCNLEKEPGVVHFLLIGVMNADQQLLKEGAQGAVYHAVIRWSHEHSYEAVNIGEAIPPYLEDSVLQYKRKWGIGLRVLPTIRTRIWLKIQRDTPAVRQFFKDSPLIIIGEYGQLQGLIVVDDPSNITEATLNEWNAQYATPGLDGLLVCSMADLFNESVSVRKTG
jgi:hypothetical protein